MGQFCHGVETVSITDNKLPVYLLSCCSPDLKSNVEKANPTISTQTEVEVLAAINGMLLC